MTIFLHIGHHKTGTTSIQAALHHNRQRLRDTYSINYPDFAQNHWPFAAPFLSGERFAFFRTLDTDPEVGRLGERAVEQFRKDVARYRTHVLSAEDFFHLHRPTLENLRRFFGETGHDVRVIAYVRHPADLASSKLNQRVVLGVATLDDFNVRPNFAKIALENYVAAFGREAITVRRFGAPYFKGGDLMEDFLSLIHPEPVVLEPTGTRNESMTTPSLRLIEALNRIAPKGTPGRASHSYLRKIDGPKFKAPRAVVEKFLAEQSESLAYFASEFGLRFDDVDLSKFPEAMDVEFSDETIASIAKILNEQSVEIRTLKAELARLGRRADRRPLGRLLAKLRGSPKAPAEGAL